MKLSGDVPQRHKELAEELSKMEKETDSSKMPSERRAQGYTCLAHDWYQIGMEEEGNRLLAKAEGTCPGYFKEKVFEHAKENKDFAIVMKNITIELLYLFGQLKERK